jgi:hypothetical protein
MFVTLPHSRLKGRTRRYKAEVIRVYHILAESVDSETITIVADLSR